MPDIQTFLEKHRQTAHQHSIPTAVSTAIAELGVWTYSRVRDHTTQPALIWHDEWDICLVIDACRWDLWQEYTRETAWPTDNPAWSAGSASPEWYGNTFTPSQLPHDERIGVITANPFASKDPDRMPTLLGDATPLHRLYALAHVDYVYEDAWGCTVDDSYLDVTHPGVVTDRAYDAWTTHDLDRLVVHYMQPHIPFRSRPEWFGRRENLAAFGERDPETPYQQENTEVWKAVRDGTLDRNAVWAAYRDNLTWVMEHVRRLQRAVDADLLLTSDHGNAMGEYGLWSHPPRMHTPQLRRVPWVHLTGENGVWEPSDIEPSPDQTVGVEEQLRALGYAD